MKRAAWAGAAAVAVLAAGCQAPLPSPVRTMLPSTPASATSASPASPRPGAATPGSTAPQTSACAAFVARLTPAERVGQLFVVGVRGEVDAAERRVFVERHAGAAILMGGADAGDTARAIGALSTRIEPMITVDQEGGSVQRLKGGGFDTIPPATQQARLSDAALRAAWKNWGTQLRDAGIHLTFAPVADVVPAAKATTNEPVGKLQRGYGSNPATVAAKVVAVVEGLNDAGVGSSAKHFPGLGEVVGNTDFSQGVADTVTGAGSASLGSFKAAILSHVDTVMVATAVYQRIDGDNPAAFSPAVMRLLREDLGFRGVVASDDLGAAKAVSGVAPGDRAVRFLRAGGDWVVVVEPGVAGTMMDAVVAAAASDPALERRVSESAVRVLELKQRRGVATCPQG